MPSWVVLWGWGFSCCGLQLYKLLPIRIIVSDPVSYRVLLSNHFNTDPVSCWFILWCWGNSGYSMCINVLLPIRIIILDPVPPRIIL